MNEILPIRLCGSVFNINKLDILKKLIQQHSEANRTRIARLACEEFGWVNHQKKYKEMSARVALLKLERRNFITLPAPTKKNGNRKREDWKNFYDVDIPEIPLHIAVGKFEYIELKKVASKTDSYFWNG